MSLLTDNNKDLETYFQNQATLTSPCDDKYKAKWWRFTPYNIQETIYYFLKHLALPTVGVVVLILIIFFRILNIPILDSLILFLTYCAIIILLSVVRERLRARKYEIPEEYEIKDVYNYSIEDFEDKFKIPSNRITETANIKKYKIGFLGDIMMLKKYKTLDFDSNVVKFFRDVDLIVGNLEGIVTKKKGIAKQYHPKDILKQLSTLLSGNTKMLLCLSNNHSLDFGSKDLNDSIKVDIHNELQNLHLKDKIYLFGRNDVPNVKIKDKWINISTATEWSNQNNWDCISKYEDIDDNKGIKSLYRKDHFNILYPHWGYENEKYVRSRIQKDARALLTGKKQTYSCFQKFIRKFFVEKITHSKDKKWDLIFGQHPHVRQPIMWVDDDEEKVKKFVAFCGGNFTSGANIIRKKKHIYGILFKFDIGLLHGSNRKLAMGNVEWRRTVNEKIRTADNTEGKKVCIDTSKYRTFNINTLIIGIVVLVLSGILWLINIFI